MGKIHNLFFCTGMYLFLEFKYVPVLSAQQQPSKNTTSIKNFNLYALYISYHGFKVSILQSI